MYATVEDADTYIYSRYLLTNINPELYTNWETLSEEAKNTLLEIAGISINNLPFTGRVSVVGQALPFPRFPETEVSNEVKYAQIEEALAYTNPQFVQARQSYESMVARGVSRYQIGQLSETFNRGEGSALVEQLSPKARMFLQKYLSGGYVIC